MHGLRRSVLVEVRRRQAACRTALYRVRKARARPAQRSAYGSALSMGLSMTAGGRDHALPDSDRAPDPDLRDDGERAPDADQGVRLVARSGYVSSSLDPGIAAALDVVARARLYEASS